MTLSNAQLRQFIMQAFSDEELETLCFDYFPEVQQNFTDGMTKNRKALALISYCDSRGRRDDLLATLEQQRPSRWKEWFGEGNSDRFIHPQTGIELIRIPAGPFQYGEMRKTKTILLPEFWIGRYPVTNAQYKQFLDANVDRGVPYGYQTWAQPYSWDQKARTYPDGKADHPVVLVSWYDAIAFCEWSALQLPTEQEWEKAARGDMDDRAWPWGSEWIDGRCNTYEAGIGMTTPVDHYSSLGVSPYGCEDMAGNVWEWTNNWYDNEQNQPVLRGGSWLGRSGNKPLLNGWPQDRLKRNIDAGFRVAATAVTGS